MWLIMYGIVFSVSCILGLLLTVLMRSFALSIGFVDVPGHHKAHVKPVPLLGGAAIFLSMVITISCGIIVASMAVNQGIFSAYVPAEIKRYIPGVFQVMHKIAGIGLASAIIFVLGIVDDRKSLGALPKLVFQILAGTIVFSMGLRITLFTSNILISYVLTVFWILLITNAFNLLDNTDGLSGGVACVAGSIFLLLSLFQEQYFVTLLFFVYVGAILGFLVFNFHPAKIYMGDAGSMLIGFILAVGTLLGTYYYPGLPSIFAVAMPLLVLAVPIYDTLSVIVIRKKNHKPIYQGDRNHFSHRLMNLGMSKPGAVLMIYLITFATGVSSLLLQMVEWQGVLIILVQVITFLLIVAILEYYGKNKGHTS